MHVMFICIKTRLFLSLSEVSPLLRLPHFTVRSRQMANRWSQTVVIAIIIICAWRKCELLLLARLSLTENYLLSSINIAPRIPLVTICIHVA